MYGVDAPLDLIKMVVEKSTDANPDVIIVNGDIVGHDHAAESTDNQTVVDQKWNATKDIMNTSFGVIRQQFPDKIILPTIGNNDVKIHNQVPCD